MTKNPKKILPMIRNAGAIFLGEWTPEALGDYSAGPNHTLPTGGTARFSSPLGVYDFIKRSSLLSFTQNGFKKLAMTVKTIAEAEGLEAHAGNSGIPGTPYLILDLVLSNPEFRNSGDRIPGTPYLILDLVLSNP